jgi:hypothetical protein
LFGRGCCSASFVDFALLTASSTASRYFCTATEWRGYSTPDQPRRNCHGPDYQPFHYALLSAYSFDIATGDVKFHFPKEAALQKILATRFGSKGDLPMPGALETQETTIGHLRRRRHSGRS